MAERILYPGSGVHLPRRRGTHAGLGLVAILCCLSTSTSSSLGREYGSAVYPSFEQLQSRLERWQGDHSRIMKLREMGTSVQGRPLLAAILTDPDAPAEDKEHVLITALHCGGERSAATGIFLSHELAPRGRPTRSGHPGKIR